MNRIPERERPRTEGFLELHVFFVPEEKWNSKLNNAPVEAIDGFLSAGFIRVHPDVSLKILRDEIGGLLGAEKILGNFSFLKCVGRSLALVKAKQERELKVKSFVPPFAPHPELYLLPMLENGASVTSHSLTPDRQSCRSDLQSYSERSFCMPVATKMCSKLPQIKQQQPPLTQIIQGLGSFSTSDDKEEDFHSQEPGWDEVHTQVGRNQHQTQSALEQAAPEPQARRKTYIKTDSCFQRKYTTDSGLPESLEDGDSGFSPSKARNANPSQPLKYIYKKPNNHVQRNPSQLSPPEQYSQPPAPHHRATATSKPTASVSLTDRDGLIEQIKLLKEEREQLERTRQGLLRKGKDLVAQYRYRRNKARDSWKRRYFDTKKATEPLESSLKSLRQDLEAIYHKLLHQLHARVGRYKTKHQGRPYAKNELIIQIIAASNEIDNLKKKVDDAKMKLLAELKLQKQAAIELLTLKAELKQKVQPSLLVPHTYS